MEWGAANSWPARHCNRPPSRPRRRPRSSSSPGKGIEDENEDEEARLQFGSRDGDGQGRVERHKRSVWVGELLVAAVLRLTYSQSQRQRSWGTTKNAITCRI